MSEPEQKGAFPQTRWSLVLDAQGDDPAALADLCKTYWFPLYCYARRLRNDPGDAEDLTQGFFEFLLEKDGFGKVVRERGKMRTFLLTALKNFSAGEWRNANRQKRGGDIVHVAIDGLAAEQRLRLEPQDALTPELEFDRAWARQLLAQVLEGLAKSYVEAGKGELFEQLRDQLVPGGEQRPYAEVAAQLGVSEPSVRLAAFKVRKRYQEKLREAIAETVSSEAEIGEELRHLRGVFGD